MLLRGFLPLSFPQGTDQLPATSGERLGGHPVTVLHPGPRVAGVVGQAFAKRLRLVFTTGPAVPRIVEIGARDHSNPRQASSAAEQATPAAQG